MTKTEMLRLIADARADLATLAYQVRQPGRLQDRTDLEIRRLARLVGNAAGAVGSVEFELDEMHEARLG